MRNGCALQKKESKEVFMPCFQWRTVFLSWYVLYSQDNPQQCCFKLFNDKNGSKKHISSLISRNLSKLFSPHWQIFLTHPKQLRYFFLSWNILKYNMSSCYCRVLIPLYGFVKRYHNFCPAALINTDFLLFQDSQWESEQNWCWWMHAVGTRQKISSPRLIYCSSSLWSQIEQIECRKTRRGMDEQRGWTHWLSLLLQSAVLLALNCYLVVNW